MIDMVIDDKTKLFLGAAYSAVGSGGTRLTTATVDDTRNLLTALPDGTAIPDIGFDVSDAILLAWDDGDNYLECEIFGNGDIEYFYRNRITENKWMEVATKDSPIPPRVEEYLRLFHQ